VASVDTVWDIPCPVGFCAECEGYFLLRTPSDEDVSRYYAKTYHSYSRAAFLAKRLFRWFRSRSQHQFIQHHCRTPMTSLLEVGAADGLLLSLFQQAAVRVGIELNDRMREYGRRKHHLELVARDFANIEGERQFDLIIMSHTIEHFLDVNMAVAKAHALLKPGGFFFIEVPNSPKPAVDSVDQIKAYLQTPHIVNFTVESLRRLVERHRFKVRGCVRCTYRLPTGLNEARRRKLAGVLLEGAGMTLSQVPSTLRYILASSLAPERSYRDIAEGSAWQGLGDNIRMVAVR
jgi:SAM-dependent methyltransferase